MIKTAFPLAAFVIAVLSACGESVTERMASEPAEPLTFAVYGNTGFVNDSGETMKALADIVNDSGSDFAVDLGNRLAAGVSSSGMDALLDTVDADRDLFAVPVYPVVGKNDIFDFESDILYSSRYGPLWYAFDRNGVRFVVLDTEDDAYRYGFGVRACLSEEQLTWLRDCLGESRTRPVVVLMNRPLWETAPEVWKVDLLPVFRETEVDLIVSCADRGLFDWGRVDGIRAVSTGCAGPAGEKGIGLFTHVLLVHMDGDSIMFEVCLPDGSVRDGIGIDSDTIEKTETLVSSLALPVPEADNAWKISESLRLSVVNPFAEPVSGSLRFTIYGGTSWNIEPPSLDISLDPGDKKTFHLSISALPPELGPQPVYQAELRVGDTDVWETRQTLTVRIPSPRFGEPVPVHAGIADIVPYDFGRGSLKIPVTVDGFDTCGRLVIYRKNGFDPPECIHISPLSDFRPGINEFSWNGRDLRGEYIPPDTLDYRIFAYNKKAPATWVAVGPPSNYGTVYVERTIAGIEARTHDSSSLSRFRIGSSTGRPQPEPIVSFNAVLEGLPLTGFAYGEGDRVYLGTPAGIACVLVRKGNAVLDRSFGEGGYVRFTEYRGREIGSPSYGDGMVYIGIGGDDGTSPCIAVIDGEEGVITAEIGLGDLFGEERLPPAVSTAEHGLYCAHPDRGRVIRMSLDGEIMWVTGDESWVVGTDSDNRSFMYGIGVDRDGFSYVNTPGSSARCVVIGPDGRGLFRVILVSLPGLRVSSVVPVIEEEDTDGLYFVTRGGDVPYVFHVPFTMRNGIIVDEAEYIR